MVLAWCAGLAVAGVPQDALADAHWRPVPDLPGAREQLEANVALGEELALVTVGSWIRVESTVSTLALDSDELRAAVLPDPPASAGFGRAVDVSGAWVAITSNPGGPEGTDDGEVHVYRRADGAWRLDARLEPPRRTPCDRFGSDVAVDGDTLAVAATTADCGPPVNSVFVYRRRDDAWRLDTELRPPPETVGTIRNSFGRVVELQGDTLVITDDLAIGGGAVHVYGRRDGEWSPDATLGVAEESEGLLGWNAALSGDVLVAGALRPAEGLRRDHVVHVFERAETGWERTAVLESPDGEGQRFGTALAVAGEEVLITAGDPFPTLFTYERTADGWTLRERSELPARGCVASLSANDDLVVAGMRAWTTEEGPPTLVWLRAR